ncbi:Uncharacterized protein Rs2_28820 [Raphanus sativus]|uniref:Protein SHORT ROOT IN SALT MEDIUM 1-like isoform X2 n=1 Tax=Raphanus sativus TaxID=3726 RepID=A0A9W3BZR7_RAPSA|nr:protein SHORT ROOT IN SALT MEDIUM 1-like isoform X2 [Raphanus sativus]KAJ4889072.1 Uncharacterized protein Rs2_28820 [Raphanus sativus]
MGPRYLCLIQNKISVRQEGVVAGYGQQLYGCQSGYPQNLGTAYPGSTVSGAEGVSQIPLTSRQPSIIICRKVSCRSHLSTATHYRKHGSVYGATSLNSSQPLSTQGVGRCKVKQLLDMLLHSVTLFSTSKKKTALFRTSFKCLNREALTMLSQRTVTEQFRNS